MESGVTIFSFIGDNRNINFIFNNMKNDEHSIIELFELYSWVYSEGNNADKFKIVRNTIAHYFLGMKKERSLSELLGKLSDIKKTISTNYNMYLNNNIEEYFKQKNKINDYITDYSKKASLQIDSLVDNLNKILTTTVGVVVIALIGYTLRASDLLVFVFLIYLGFLIISIWLSLIYSKRKMDLIEKEYLEIKNSFKEIFNNDFPPDDIKTDYQKMFNEYYKKLKYLIIILIIITFFILLLLILIYLDPKKSF